MDVAAVKAGAVTRTLARRRPPKIRTYVDQVTGEVVRTEDRTIGGSDEIAPPADLSQWIDDTIVRVTPGVVGETLIVVLEAARAGEREAVAAVSAARRLDPWSQYNLWQALGSLSGAPAPGGQVLAAVKREWRALRLAEHRPHEWNVLNVERPGSFVATDSPPGTRLAPATERLLGLT